MTAYSCNAAISILRQIICSGKAYGNNVGGPFAKFVDSPHYSQSELCRGAVTVSFSKYHPLQAIYFLQRFTHFSKTLYRSLITSKFLPRSSVFVVGKAQKSHGSRSELNYVFGLEKVDRWNAIRTSVMKSRSRPMQFRSFSNHGKGAPRQISK
jgi:hypothetical protein